MKKTLLITILLVMISLISTQAYAEWVNGYYRSDGTYVQGYHRSSPNSTKSDNYGPSQSALDRISPNTRDYDGDGLPNIYDFDDDNDGVQDDYDSSQYNSSSW